MFEYKFTLFQEVLVRDSTGNLVDMSPKSGKLIGLAGGAATGKVSLSITYVCSFSYINHL